jgi:hypothetical protein
MRVIIELEFDDKPTDADVYNYLNELMDNECLGYEIKENEDDNVNHDYTGGDSALSPDDIEENE